MRIGKILDPDFQDAEKEVQAIYDAVASVGYISRRQDNAQDDRIFIDISGYGENIYRAFCYKFPAMADRLIPVRASNRRPCPEWRKKVTAIG